MFTIKRRLNINARLRNCEPLARLPLKQEACFGVYEKTSEPLEIHLTQQVAAIPFLCRPLLASLSYSPIQNRSS